MAFVSSSVLCQLFTVFVGLVSSKLSDIIVGGNFLTLNKCGQYPIYQQWTFNKDNSIVLSGSNSTNIQCLICSQDNPDNLLQQCRWGFIPAISNSINICNPAINKMASWNVQNILNTNLIRIQPSTSNICIQSIGNNEYSMILTMKCNLTYYNYLYQEWIYNETNKYIISSMNKSLCLTASLYKQRNCTQKPFQTYSYCNKQLPTNKRVNDLISRMTFYEKISNLGHWNIGVPRLGIPPNTIAECLHGIVTVCGKSFNNNTGCPTSFPNPLLLGATFNRSLWNKIGSIISDEGRALYNQGIGGLYCFAPNINLLKDPRWGRAQEVPGEDPYLTGEYGIQYVNGIQYGIDSKYLKMSATLKHYGDYDLEGGHYNITSRLAINLKVNNQDQVEYYWPAWKTVIELTNPGSIMCSYPSINGIPACSNDYFMNKIARDEWGFNGYIMSDGGALNDEAQTIYVEDNNDGINNNLWRTKHAIESGCDTNSGSVYISYLNESYNRGYITMNTIDTALKRWLTVAIRLGNLDEPGPYYNNYGPEMIDTEYSRDLAFNAAQQGIVLLKNLNNILPLKRDKTIRYGFIGPHFNVTQEMLSNYHGDNIVVNKHSPYQIGIKQGLNIKYSIGCDVICNSTNGFNDAINIAKTVDFVVIFLGLYPKGEKTDALEAESYDRYNLTFPGYQLDLLKQIYLNNRNVILIMINSSPIDITYAKLNIPAILCAFYPGEFGGDAIISILYGDTSPTGKLPYTIYNTTLISDRNITDMSLSNNYGITYRYYEKEPVYPFGFGLYYTNFSYIHYNDSLELKIINSFHLLNGNNISYKIGVKNIGKMDSDCIVLGFIDGSENNNNTNDGNPNIKLFDFQRVFVQIGKIVNVTLTITANVISLTNKHGIQKIVPNKYKIYVGDYRNNNYLEAYINIVGNEQVLTNYFVV